MSEGHTNECDNKAEHLEDVASGAGCTEVWERLAEKRAETES